MFNDFRGVVDDREEGVAIAAALGSKKVGLQMPMIYVGCVDAHKIPRLLSYRYHSWIQWNIPS